jgi:hypothetical protein
MLSRIAVPAALTAAVAISTQGLKYGASDSTAAGALDHIALEWEAARAELADVLDRLDALEKRA